eukprot:CAMPEP_0172448168 /NCGR_PEP_ID=MMETSP1065-20121228/7237_1 /TAXON_ID=265537 /ORGANISM="Amphiprora paludosa, Strain CCMP125" /LENGTH=301 /DNA_ID=CAMNT_0013199583 /DNA_START=476 /DNA_END=1381 /DNA_ORIENTATION=+
MDTSSFDHAAASPVKRAADPTDTSAVPADNNGDYLQWVDYLPGQLPKSKPRASLDPSETNMTESNSVSQAQQEDGDDGNMMDSSMMEVEENWPETNSLEGYSMMPHYLLVEQDPVLQHELALGSATTTATTTSSSLVPNSNCSISLAASSGEDPSIAPELFANNLEELLEQRRRHLATMMQASMRTRQCLEPHIRQRAGLSNVLSQIERSSWTIHEHLLVNNNNKNRAETLSATEEELPPPPETEIPEPTTAASVASLGNASDADTCNSVDMTGVTAGLPEDGSVDDFAAAVLNDPEDCLL